MREYLTWDDFEREIKSLYEKISLYQSANNYKLNAIIGIARGGVIPARRLSSKMHVKRMYFLSVEKDDDERRVVTDILANLSGYKILLVEDCLESGKSLEVAKSYLENKGAEVMTASMYVTPQTETMPDFYIGLKQEVPHFPWEDE